MNVLENISKPSKEEQKVAKHSYNALSSTLKQIQSDKAEIEIEETKEKIVLPLKALLLLEGVLKAMSEGKPISIVPLAAEVTTQKAAEILGCSRPYIVKLLEEGLLPYTLVGKHRRILFEDVMSYKKKMKEEQKKNLIDIMSFDEEIGLYDS